MFRIFPVSLEIRYDKNLLYSFMKTLYYILIYFDFEIKNNIINIKRKKSQS